MPFPLSGLLYYAYLFTNWNIFQICLFYKNAAGKWEQEKTLKNTRQNYCFLHFSNRVKFIWHALCMKSSCHTSMLKSFIWCWLLFCTRNMKTIQHNWTSTYSLKGLFFQHDFSLIVPIRPYHHSVFVFKEHLLSCIKIGRSGMGV